MDSKQLFRFYHSNFFLSNWLNEQGQLALSEGDVKWFYCGVNQDFKAEIVNQSLNSFFSEEEVYLCISSNKSSLVQKSNISNEISKILHKKELGIMNKSFTKIMEFTSIGTFKMGIIRDFPKERIRPLGEPLKVEFHANIVDNNTQKIAAIIRKNFSNIESELLKDYGGSIEHLWIDLELVENYKTWPFRFQKRVKNPTSYTEFYSYNVAHYSVRPDFEKLQTLTSEEQICNYVFELLLKSTQILDHKKTKLEKFNANKFRLDFLSACKKLGYTFES